MSMADVKQLIEKALDAKAITASASKDLLLEVAKALDEAKAELTESLRAPVNDAVRTVISKLWSRYLGGQFWVGGYWYGSSAYLSFFREVCHLELPGDLWDRSIAYEATGESACWWWPHKQFVAVSERPSILSVEVVPPRNEQEQPSRRLHSATGPSLAWPDGWAQWHWHGVRVPRHVVEAPEKITVDEIEHEDNAEVRRVLIERYGQARFLQDSGAEVIHRDDWGTLYRKEMPGDEPLLMVKVVDATPEPDGTFKDYFIRVDPQCRPLGPNNQRGEPQELTALNAVASTFGKTGAEYKQIKHQQQT